MTKRKQDGTHFTFTSAGCALVFVEMRNLADACSAASVSRVCKYLSYSSGIAFFTCDLV